MASRTARGCRIRRASGDVVPGCLSRSAEGGNQCVDASQLCCFVGRLVIDCSVPLWNRVEVAQPSREHLRHAAPALAREVDCAPRAVGDADFVVTAADVAPIPDPRHIAEVRGPPDLDWSQSPGEGTRLGHVGELEAVAGDLHDHRRVILGPRHEGARQLTGQTVPAAPERLARFFGLTPENGFEERLERVSRDRGESRDAPEGEHAPAPEARLSDRRP